MYLLQGPFFYFFGFGHRGSTLWKKEQNASAPNTTLWWNSRREPTRERDTGEIWMLYMQLNIEKNRRQKSLIKRRVLKGDHPESENISNFGFSVTDGQQMHIIQICVLLTLICEISFLVIFWSYNFNNRLFDDIFCGDSTLCQLPKFKDGHKRNLVCLCVRKSGAVFLLTYFDWLLKWKQMADQFSSDLAIFQLLQKSVFNLNFDLDNIFDQTLVFKYHIQSRKRRVLISQTFLNTMYMWLLWALFRYFWSWQIKDFNEHRRRTFRVLLFSELSKEF